MRLNAEDVVAQRSTYETALSEEFTSGSEHARAIND